MKKSKKFLRKFGDSQAQWAYTFMSLGNTRLDLANDLGISTEQFSKVEAQSKDFKDAVTVCTQMNLARDLKFVKKHMADKTFNAAAAKIYFANVYNIGDKPVPDDTLGNIEEFGFDITVRPKE